jgi:anaerobic carbon-monoxide dehydrogenase iron sulfur subunit
MTTPTATPPIDELLALPLFQDVDKKLLEGIKKEAAITAGTFEWPAGVAKRAGFVQFREVAAGDVITAQGDLTTDFVIVLAGQVEALQARARNETYRHRSYGGGDWFGEVSAHSHHPALASYRATTAARIATFDARLFSKLYAEDEEWKNRIDEGYRENLPLHLRAASLCRDLDDQALAALQAAASLITVEDGDVLATTGEPAETVWLVRAGAIACRHRGANGARDLAFYKGNATFGEHAVLTSDATWPADYVALMRTTLVALPRQAFAQLENNNRQSLLRAANRLIGRPDVDANDQSAGQSRALLDELQVMVENESVKGGRALVIDRSKCVRCNMCVESCVAVHDDGIPRLSKVGTPVMTDEVLVTACYHCETPQCMLSCDYAAIRRDPQGRIRFEYDNCVGCAGCIDGCPYGVIRLVEPFAPPPPKNFFQSLPLIGRLFGGGGGGAAAPALDKDGKPEKPKSAGVGAKLTPIAGKTIKCDLCAGLPFEACVYNCPTTAILRKEPQSLFDRRGL